MIRDQTRPSTPENVQAAADDHNIYASDQFIYII